MGIIIAITMFIISIVLFIFDLLQPGIATILAGAISAVIGLISKCMDMNENKKNLMVGHNVKGKKNKIEEIDIQAEKSIEIEGKIGHKITGDENEVGRIKYVRK